MDQKNGVHFTIVATNRIWYVMRVRWDGGTGQGDLKYAPSGITPQELRVGLPVVVVVGTRY